MIQILIFFLLFLVQFIYFPVGSSFFEGAKVIASEILISALIILQFFSNDSLKFKAPKRILIGVIAILVMLSCYHLIINKTQTILFGNQFRLQGTLLLWFLLAFAFFTSNTSIEDKIKPWLIFGILLLQFIFAILFVGVGADRPVGTLGEPNALAANVIFLWPFLFFPKPNNWKDWVLGLTGIGIVIVTVLITGSRSGVIAFGIQLAFLYLVRTFYGKPLFPTILSTSLILLSFAIPFFLPTSSIYENRSEIWQSSLDAASRAPVVGVGFGNAEYALHHAAVRLGNHLPGYYVDSAHNIFLDWLVQGGIIALIILFFLVLNTLKNFVYTENLRNITLFLGLIASLSFNPASVVSLLAFWWLIGQGLHKIES